MNKHELVGPVVLVVLGLGTSCSANDAVEETASSQQAAAATATFDGRNSSFTVDENLIRLRDGLSETPVENSSAKVVTRYLGNEAHGDLNGDGLTDQAFWVTHSTGGSGTYYYVVVALNLGDRYMTTNAFRVGDRIAPQAIEIHSDAQELHVNFSGRREGEPMTAQTSEGKVLLLKVSPDGVLEGLMK